MKLITKATAVVGKSESSACAHCKTWTKPSDKDGPACFTLSRCKLPNLELPLFKTWGSFVRCMMLDHVDHRKGE
jgi:hypothetical protein